MAEYFPRKELATLGFSQTLINYFEKLGRDITVVETEVGEGTDLTAINAQIAALQAALALAQQEAEDAPLKVPTRYFDPAEVLELTDLTILTEGGDDLFTEAADSLLIEA
jgi:hypothetical protein